MNRNRISFGVAVALVMTLASGCATMGKKSPEEQVRAQLSTWRDGLMAKDLDLLMSVYSEDFTSDQGGTKSDLRNFVQGAIDAGYIDNAEVRLDNTIVTVEGDKAIASPVQLVGPMGGMDLKLEFAQEAEGWMIVYSSEA